MRGSTPINLKEKTMSHHGQNQQSIPEDLLKAFQRKVQGEFPDGRLNKHDEGAIGVAIGHEGGKVVMQFPSTVTWIGFTPNQAMELAQSLIEHAKKAGITAPFTLTL